MNRHRQRGVALISVLAVFTLMVILIGSQLQRDQLDQYRATHHAGRQQALEYALSAEVLARQLLFEDWQADKDRGQTTDHLNEGWHTHAQFDPDRGDMRVRITDLHQQFNINNLVNNEQQRDGDAGTLFQHLLNRLNLPPDTAKGVADWIDADTTPQHYQSEDSSLLALSPPRRSADRAMADISEIRASELLSAEQLKQLQPFVVALPAFSAINVNTASATVLSALHQNLNGDAIVALRENSPFQTVEQFLQSPPLFGLTVPTGLISVSSDYFQVDALVQVDKVQLLLRTRLHRQRDSGKILLLSRTLVDPSLAADIALTGTAETEKGL